MNRFKPLDEMKEAHSKNNKSIKLKKNILGHFELNYTDHTSHGCLSSI